MSKQRKQLVNCVGKLRSTGWEVSFTERNTIRPHNGNETIEHWLLKCAICNEISNRGRCFYTEVKHEERGRADILDLHAANGLVYIYEVETGLTREREKAKARQYTDNFECKVIYDVFCVDSTEIESISELPERARCVLV